MARFTPRTTEREMRSAWWDIKESEYLGCCCMSVALQLAAAEEIATELRLAAAAEDAAVA